MADPIAPTADDTAQLKAATNDVKNLAIALAGFGPTSTEFHEAFSKMVKDVSGLGGILKASGGAIEEFISEFKFDDINKYIDMASQGMEKFGDAGGLALLPMLNMIKLNTDAFGKFSEAGASAGMNITDSFKGLEGILSKIPVLGALSPMMGRLAESAAPMQNLEMNLLAVSAASGNLNDFMKQTGNNFEGLTDAASAYNEKLYVQAQANGMLISKVAEYEAALMKVPGAMNVTSETTSNTLKIATAYGISATAMAEQMSLSQRNYNSTQEHTNTLIASMAVAAKDLNMPLDIMKESVNKSASAFKSMGDNTQGAINILTRMGDALKNSGIGPAAIASITEGMIDGIQQMDISQKAFISSQSGGRGGLAGAFQIDKMLQNNDLAGVMDMAQKAIKKQFGGNVVTLDEAVKNPNQAGQLTKEIQYLKEFGMAKSTSDAERILDVMKKGGSYKDISDIGKSPEAALKEAVTQGSTIEQKQNTELIKLSNEATKYQQIISASSLELVRNLVGNKGGQLTEFMNEKAKEAKMTPGNKEMGGAGLFETKSVRGFTKERIDNATDPHEMLGFISGALKNVKDYASRGIGKPVEDLVNGKPQEETIDDAMHGKTTKQPSQSMLTTLGLMKSTPENAQQVMALHQEKRKGAGIDEVMHGKPGSTDGVLTVKVNVTTDSKAQAEQVFEKRWKDMMNKHTGGVVNN